MNIGEVQPSDIGRGVIYHSGWGDVEQGVITSVSATYVFVRYLGDTASKATRPEDLTFLISMRVES